MRLFPQRKSQAEPEWPTPMQLAAAYAVCRSISRAAARNFYYAFLALPREKRDAICAVYAFMRQADDITDEPGLSAGDRLQKLSDWIGRFDRAIAGERTDDPVLLALADAQQRFAIRPELLAKLVAGTAMDLTEAARVEAEERYAAIREGGVSPETAVSAPAQVTVGYETFSELYQYCYHVASVVGLICIRIFGYSDPAAEPLAERCGIAFQLTNIIRDVREDAAMGRIYLPKEDLERFGRDPLQLVRQGTAEQLAADFRPVLEFEAERAREFYAAAEELLPLIDEDSRPALWVLITIYRRLLEKIAARDFDVFAERVRLSTLEKSRVLGKGLWLRLI